MHRRRALATSEAARALPLEAPKLDHAIGAHRSQPMTTVGARGDAEDAGALMRTPLTIGAMGAAHVPLTEFAARGADDHLIVGSTRPAHTASSSTSAALAAVSSRRSTALGAARAREMDEAARLRHAHIPHNDEAGDGASCEQVCRGAAPTERIDLCWQRMPCDERAGEAVARRQRAHAPGELDARPRRGRSAGGVAVPVNVPRPKRSLHHMPTAMDT